MNRRELLVAASAALLAPFAARAQQAGRLYRVGWLDHSSAAENLGIFDQAMTSRGWVKGRNFAVEYRGGDGQAQRLAAVADELARLPADLIVAPGTREALAAKKATAAIPIVMIGVDDPVERGLVASLARPGGNVTGLGSARGELSGKLLSLVREILPKGSSVAILWDANDPDSRTVVTQVQAAARTLGVPLNAVEVRHYTDVERTLAAIRKQGNRMLIVPWSSMLIPGWIADLALKNGLPLASTSAAYAYEGGLIAYSADWNAVFERVAAYVDRIFKGARPAELPVELPTKFKLIVNAKTAQALGLTISPSIMVRADHVIE